MSQLISNEYRDLQQAFHTERPDYGISSGKYVDQVRHLAEQIKTRSILDYGCGKALLAKGLPFPIQSYDPCIPEYSRKPEPADIVVCTDVLEHIEPMCIDAVLEDLARLTQKLLLIDVACRPAKKFLPDGRNAHLLQCEPHWWLSKLMPLMRLHSFQENDGAFVAILLPHFTAENADA